MTKIMNKDTIKKVKCKRKTCGHTWWPKKPGRPNVCPKCHSPLWDKDEQNN